MQLPATPEQEVLRRVVQAENQVASLGPMLPADLPIPQVQAPAAPNAPATQSPAVAPRVTPNPAPPQPAQNPAAPPRVTPNVAPPQFRENPAAPARVIPNSAPPEVSQTPPAPTSNTGRLFAEAVNQLGRTETLNNIENQLSQIAQLENVEVGGVNLTQRTNLISDWYDRQPGTDPWAARGNHTNIDSVISARETAASELRRARESFPRSSPEYRQVAARYAENQARLGELRFYRQHADYMSAGPNGIQVVDVLTSEQMNELYTHTSNGNWVMPHRRGAPVVQYRILRSDPAFGDLFDTARGFSTLDTERGIFEANRNGNWASPVGMRGRNDTYLRPTVAPGVNGTPLAQPGTTVRGEGGISNNSYQFFERRNMSANTPRVFYMSQIEPLQADENGVVRTENGELYATEEAVTSRNQTFSPAEVHERLPGGGVRTFDQGFYGDQFSVRLVRNIGELPMGSVGRRVFLDLQKRIADEIFRPMRAGNQTPEAIRSSIQSLRRTIDEAAEGVANSIRTNPVEGNYRAINRITQSAQLEALERAVLQLQDEILEMESLVGIPASEWGNLRPGALLDIRQVRGANVQEQFGRAFRDLGNMEESAQRLPPQQREIALRRFGDRRLQLIGDVLGNEANLSQQLTETQLNSFRARIQRLLSVNPNFNDELRTALQRANPRNTGEALSMLHEIGRRDRAIVQANLLDFANDLGMNPVASQRLVGLGAVGPSVRVENVPQASAVPNAPVSVGQQLNKGTVDLQQQNKDVIQKNYKEIVQRQQLAKGTEQQLNKGTVDLQEQTKDIAQKSSKEIVQRQQLTTNAQTQASASQPPETPATRAAADIPSNLSASLRNALQTMDGAEAGQIILACEQNPGLARYLGRLPVEELPDVLQNLRGNSLLRTQIVAGQLSASQCANIFSTAQRVIPAHRAEFLLAIANGGPEVLRALPSPSMWAQFRGLAIRGAIPAMTALGFAWEAWSTVEAIGRINTVQDVKNKLEEEVARIFQTPEYVRREERGQIIYAQQENRNGSWTETGLTFNVTRLMHLPDAVLEAAIAEAVRSGVSLGVSAITLLASLTVTGGVVGGLLTAPLIVLQAPISGAFAESAARGLRRAVMGLDPNIVTFFSLSDATGMRSDREVLEKMKGDWGYQSAEDRRERVPGQGSPFENAVWRTVSMAVYRRMMEINPAVASTTLSNNDGSRLSAAQFISNNARLISRDVGLGNLLRRTGATWSMDFDVPDDFEQRVDRVAQGQVRTLLVAAYDVRTQRLSVLRQELGKLRTGGTANPLRQEQLEEEIGRLLAETDALGNIRIGPGMFVRGGAVEGGNGSNATPPLWPAFEGSRQFFETGLKQLADAGARQAQTCLTPDGSERYEVTAARPAQGRTSETYAVTRTVNGETGTAFFAWDGGMWHWSTPQYPTWRTINESRFLAATPGSYRASMNELADQMMRVGRELRPEARRVAEASRGNGRLLLRSLLSPRFIEDDRPSPDRGAVATRPPDSATELRAQLLVGEAQDISTALAYRRETNGVYTLCWQENWLHENGVEVREIGGQWQFRTLMETGAQEWTRATPESAPFIETLNRGPTPRQRLGLEATHRLLQVLGQINTENAV